MAITGEVKDVRVPQPSGPAPRRARETPARVCTGRVQGAPAAVFARDETGHTRPLVSGRTGGRAWDSPHP